MPFNEEVIKPNPMNILVDTIRIANFRAIKNLEVKLSDITVLVGANNAGKTSLLKAMHMALGIGRRAVTKEDFHDDGLNSPEDLDIIIDVRIIPIDDNGNRIKEFIESWANSEGFSGIGIIQTDENENDSLMFRTRFRFDSSKQEYVSEVRSLKQWADFDNWQDETHESSNTMKKLPSLPLIFMDAQRDVLTDIKDRHSFLGKLTDKPDIEKEKLKAIESELITLNETIVNNSPTLNILKENLAELNNTVNAQGGGVEITPVPKQMRDIGRNLNINFMDTNSQSFPLENHGMGTRSWASLLTLKAYIAWMKSKNDVEEIPYHPLLALEEPEAHLHPNAQRQLFKQLQNVHGQKIISTHSPFVAAQAQLTDLRHFYHDENGLRVGRILLSDMDEQRISELKAKIKEEGETADIKKELCPQIKQLLMQKRGKINSKEKRKVEREVMHSKGELLFSKIMVLAEGETEEQALPLLANERFKCFPYELGINFISVGGKDKYKPFLSVAKFLNIKWYILSDGDHNTENDVKAQIKNVFGREILSSIGDKLFVLDKEDFEEYLIKNGYEEYLKNAINYVENSGDYLSEYIASKHGEVLKKDKEGNEIKRDYKSEGGENRALLDCLHSGKTKYAPAIAEQIVKMKDADGTCKIPPVIDALFNQIAADLKLD